MSAKKWALACLLTVISLGGLGLSAAQSTDSAADYEQRIDSIDDPETRELLRDVLFVMEMSEANEIELKAKPTAPAYQNKVDTQPAAHSIDFTAERPNSGQQKSLGAYTVQLRFIQGHRAEVRVKRRDGREISLDETDHFVVEGLDAEGRTLRRRTRIWETPGMLPVMQQFFPALLADAEQGSFRGGDNQALKAWHAKKGIVQSEYLDRDGRFAFEGQVAVLRIGLQLPD